MKTNTLIGATLFLLGALSSSAADRPVVGCLERDSGRFVLVTPDGNLGLLGGEGIAEHVGEKVKVTGRQLAGDVTVASIETIAGDCGPTASTAPAPPGRARSADPKPSRNRGAEAHEQGKSKADRETTALIRRALVEDDSLSIPAKNIAIITRSGHVTLRGRVRSDAERAEIQSKVEAVLGDADFSNELTVRGDPKELAPGH